LGSKLSDELDGSFLRAVDGGEIDVRQTRDGFLASSEDGRSEEIGDLGHDLDVRGRG
jgi:hypothetical protein